MEIGQGLDAIGDIDHVLRLRICGRDAHEGTQGAPTDNQLLDLVLKIYVLGTKKVSWQSTMV